MVFEQLNSRITSGDGRPDALLWGEETISWAEFAAMVRTVEALLVAAGVEPKHIVAVRGFEGWRWVAVMLAIWRAGAVYLPAVDGMNPVSEGLASFEWSVDLHFDEIDVRRENRHARKRALPDGAGYLIPTSGSTGNPKWILGRLEGLESFVNWEIRKLNVTDADTVAQLTDPTFDPVFRDLLLPLMTGARLAIPRRRVDRIDPRIVLPWLNATKTSIIHTVPTIVRGWRKAAVPVSGVLRCILLAGEQLYRNDVVALKRQFGSDVAIYNLYGPSETTLAACAFSCEDDGDFGGGNVPVGRAIDGYGVVVLDDRMKICPPYSVGEVFIRARFPSFGYFREGELDPAGFIANPVRPDDPHLVYQTGDLGHMTDRGDLVLLGRKDDQYKVGGIRVASGDIEDALRQVEGVEEAAIRIWQEAGQAVVIAAYVKSKRPLAEIKQALAGKVKGFAFPHVWMETDGLPRTINQKIDRKRLPKPVAGRRVMSSAGNATVATLLEIWHESLPFLSSIGIDDSFLAIGGKSIEGIQIVLGIEERLGVRLDIDILYDLQTIANLGEYIDRQGVPAAGRRTRASLRHRPERKLAQLTGAQRRFWRWMQVNRENLCFQFILALHLEGKIDFDRLQNAIESLLVSNDAFAMNVLNRGETAVQQKIPAGKAPPIMDLPISRSSMASVEKFVRETCARPYRFGTDSLMRPFVLRLRDDEAIVVFDNHVLASDGWSKRLLVKQLSDNYVGKQQSLPAMSFLDVACWEARDRRSWADYLPFWRERLAKIRPDGAPFRQARGNFATRKLNRLDARLGAAVSKAIAERAAEINATIETVFMAALGRALSDWTGSASGHFLVSNAKRLDPRLNEMVGCFTDSLIIGYETGETMLRDVRRIQRESYECLRHSIPSFEFILEQLRPDIDPTLPEWFPVIFAPQADYSSLLEWPGVAAASLPWSHEKCIWPIEVYPLLEDASNMQLAINYSEELFEADRVSALQRRLIDHLSAFAFTAIR